MRVIPHIVFLSNKDHNMYNTKLIKIYSIKDAILFGKDIGIVSNMIEKMNNMEHRDIESFLIANEKKEYLFYEKWEEMFGPITPQRKEEFKTAVKELCKKHGIRLTYRTD